MTHLTIYFNVASTMEELPDNPEKQLFAAFSEIIPECRLVCPVKIAQEPYLNPTIVVQLAYESQGHDQNFSAEEYIIKKIGESKRDMKMCLTFANEADTDYQSLCRLHLEDFSLGSLDLVTLHFNQFFNHAATFKKAAAKSIFLIEFDRERLFVYFAISDLAITEEDGLHQDGDDLVKPKKNTTEVYQLSLSFANIERSIYVHEHEQKAKEMNVADIYILLTAPLELWRTQDCLKRVEGINDDTKWFKTVRLKSEVKTLQTVNLSELLGDCRTLKLTLNKNYTDFQELIQSLRMNKFLINYTHVLKKPTRKENLPKRLANGEFGSDWYVQALHNLGYHVRLQFQNKKFFDFVVQNKRDNERLVRALERTYITIMRYPHAPLLKTVLHYFNSPLKIDDSVPRYNCFIRRIIVTPTRKVFLPQSLMHENRILREFSQEYAIGINFRNDDYSKLNDHFSSQEFIRETISETLKNGIRISQRHYQFLGCSGSQQRNHSCWFYAKDENDYDSEKIIDWVGNLRDEHLPGKFISRVGQCFSRTKPVDLDEFPDLVLKLREPDVRGGVKDYCFTDGVGRISREMRNEVFQRLDEQYVPSAFQMRLAGCKGMLVVDPTLEGKQILIRESMNKFPSEHRKLEIMRVATPSRLFLNKQIITLLANHRGDFKPQPRIKPQPRKKCGGIVACRVKYGEIALQYYGENSSSSAGGDREFSRLLLSMLYNLADSFVDENKAAESLGSRTRFPCPFSDLVNAGFSLTQEPFFRDMCYAAAKERVETIRKKFRVELPPDKARNMFGVVDETATLMYGEVFVQYSADVARPGEDLLVVKGKVLVSKMPCLHPGDVRVLQAVDVPDLHHHIDCIVFPQKGPRPHPDEMAGSDLDGDEYFVTWQPELMLRHSNCAPMDYSPSTAPVNDPAVKQRRESKSPITKEDMIEYLVDYINSDQIGPVASSHVVWADRIGIYSEECLKLCQLHSDVIDSNKTGQVIEAGRRNKLRSYVYPDFMDKMDHKDTYKSDSVLGRVFRISRRVGVLLSEENSQETVLNERLIMNGYERFLDSAKELRASYEDSLNYIMQEYGIETETSLVSGCSVSLTSPLARVDKECDEYDTKQLIQGRCECLIKHTRDKFFADLGLENDCKAMPALQKASACYQLVYSDVGKFHSFPWIFGDILVQVLKHWLAVNNVYIPRSPFNIQQERIQNSIQSISTTVADGYLRSRHPCNGSKYSKICYILLKWFHSCTIKSCISEEYFISLTVEAFKSGITELLEVLKYLGLVFDGKESECFTRETALAIFRLSLQGHWEALLVPSNQTQRISQTIYISKNKFTNMKKRHDFVKYLSKRFEYCTFKLRPSSRSTGLLHVIGPALNVYEVMDSFTDQFSSFNHCRGLKKRS